MERLVAVVSELQKTTQHLGIALAARSEGSDREHHLGANLRVHEGGKRPLDSSISNNDETLRFSMEADGYFTIDSETYDRIEILDQWMMRKATADLLGGKFHVIVTIDRRCTVDHLVRLLDIAARPDFDATITLILAEASNKT